MSLRATTDAGRVAGERPARRVRAMRRATFAAFVLLLIQYGLGMYVNLYVTVPAADQGQGLGTAFSTGPASLIVHAVLGFLLVLAAVGLLVQTLMARYWTILTASVIALAAIIAAAIEGIRFVDQGGPDGASMTMAVLAGVAMLCYGTVLYLTQASSSC